MAGGAVLASGSGGGNPFKTGFVARPYLWAFCLVTSLFFLWGFAYGLLDVLNKHFQEVLGITKLESTLLQVAYFGGGYLIYSPVAATILKKWSYKVTIIQGLGLYSTGAVLFWPVAKFSLTSTNPKAIFGGFVICTFVTACGLASLEVAANSYVATMPPLAHSNFRLQFSQSFNGVASFSGPLIASKYFFSGKNAHSLTNVQWVYLAVSGMGLMVAIAFIATKLPEVSEAELQAAQDAAAEAQGEVVVHKNFWRTKAPFGAAAQFFYVAAQVGIGAFFLNLSDEAGIPDHRGAQLLSYGLILFTVGRFVGTAILSVMSAPLLLGIYAMICSVLIVCIATIKNGSGVYLTMLIMFFESIMYPVIFVESTHSLGMHTRRAAGLLVMGVAGGMVWPPLMGAIADAKDTRAAFWVNLPCFLFVAGFAFYQWNAGGRQFRATKVEQEPEIEDGYAARDSNSLQDKKDVSETEKVNDLDYVERI